MSSQTDQAESAPEGGVESDGLDSRAIALIGATSVLIVVATIFAVQALYNEYRGRLYQERVVNSKYADVDRTVSQQIGKLAEYESPSAEGGAYQIPIQRAKELVLSELQQAQKDP